MSHEELDVIHPSCHLLMDNVSVLICLTGQFIQSKLEGKSPVSSLGVKKNTTRLKFRIKPESFLPFPLL